MSMKKIGELLIEKGLITEKELNYALRRQKVTGEKLGNILLKKGIVKEKDLFDVLAEHFNLKKFEGKEIVISKDLQRTVSLNTILEKRVIPLGEKDGKLMFGVNSYMPMNLANELGFEIGKKVEFYFIPDDVFNKILSDLQNFNYGKADYRYISLRDRALKKYGTVDLEIQKLISLINESEKDLSQIVINEGVNPVIKKRDGIVKLNYIPIRHDFIVRFIKEELSDLQKKELISKGYIKIFTSVNGSAFMVFVLKNKNTYTLIFNKIKKDVPDILNFNIEDDILKEFLSQRSGIYVIGAPIGHGKSSLMASIAQHFSINTYNTILFIEEDLQYDIKSVNSVVYQYETGVEFGKCFDILELNRFIGANLIFVSEIKTFDALKLLVEYAESGKKVFLSINAPNVTSSLDYLVKLVKDNDTGFLARFSNCLRICLAQRFVNLKSGYDKVFINEYIKMSLKIKKFIIENSLTSIDTQIKGSSDYVPLERKFAEFMKKDLLDKDDIYKYALDIDFVKSYLK